MLKYYIMNIILEEREDILNNNNTAQNQFLVFLKKTHQSSNIINVEESLFGDLDLSELSNSGFNKIEIIKFNKGKITNIINIPKNIKELHLQDNILIELNELPESLEVLNIENNYLSKIDFFGINNIRYLNISHNNFENLNNLPTTLTELICNNNKLTYINLFELNELKIMNASNNKLSIIDNLPNGIIKLLVDNNPNIQYHNSSSIPNISNEDNVAKSNYFNSLNQYFKLKNDYEKKLLNKKKQVFRKAPTRKSGQKLVDNVKIPCIYCKRNVGTLFTFKNRQYKAFCGDSINPCELKINIFCGDFYNLMELMDEFESTMNDLREDIINLKLDSLFDYVNKEVTIKLFEEKSKDYASESDAYSELYERYNELFNFENNTEKYDIYTKNLKFIKEKTEEAIKLSNEYKENNNIELLKSAVEIHQTEIIPTIKNNNFLLYEKIYMEDNKLNKIKASYANMETTFGEEPTVSSFKIMPSSNDNVAVNKNNKQLESQESNKSNESILTPLIERLF